MFSCDVDGRIGLKLPDKAYSSCGYIAMARLILGNTASPTPDGKRYNWTFYVRGETDELDSVTIKLHPTFKDPVRVCDKPPFEIHAKGGMTSVTVTSFISSLQNKFSRCSCWKGPQIAMQSCEVGVPSTSLCSLNGKVEQCNGQFGSYSLTRQMLSRSCRQGFASARC